MRIAQSPCRSLNLQDIAPAGQPSAASRKPPFTIRRFTGGVWRFAGLRESPHLIWIMPA